MLYVIKVNNVLNFEKDDITLTLTAYWILLKLIIFRLCLPIEIYQLKSELKIFAGWPQTCVKKFFSALLHRKQDCQIKKTQISNA